MYERMRSMILSSKGVDKHFHLRLNLFRDNKILYCIYHIEKGELK
jgi:hypothetical protein